MSHWSFNREEISINAGPTTGKKSGKIRPNGTAAIERETKFRNVKAGNRVNGTGHRQQKQLKCDAGTPFNS
jgi:hypothetical protein